MNPVQASAPAKNREQPVINFIGILTLMELKGESTMHRNPF